MRELLNVRVLRGDLGAMTNHYLMDEKLMVGMRWVKTR